MPFSKFNCRQLKIFNHQSCGDWKKFQLPSNDQGFLDGDWNPFLATTRKPTEIFQSPTIWQSKPFLVTSNYNIVLVAIEFSITNSRL
jgi:hypothetical protein